MKRIIEAFGAFWYVLTTGKSLRPAPGDSGDKAETIAPEKVKSTKSSSDKFNDGAVYTLLLLQREGRLIDFLLEDVENYRNDQIGAAVRQIHSNCQSVLNQHFAIGRIMPDKECESVSIEKSYDSLTIKLSGNVVDSYPQKGRVKHQGWKACSINFPTFSGQRNPSIIQTAEIEIE